jgi:hypothetical protein
VDHTDVALKSVVRALRDVVAPAVDPDAALAREQLRLAIDYLNFAITRVDYLYERAVFELRQHVDMAKTVRKLLAGSAVAGSAAAGSAAAGSRVAGSAAADVLDGPLVRGENLVAATTPRIDDLRQASAALATGITAVIRELETSDKQLRSEIIRTVAVASKDRVAFERSWYAPLGIDPDRAEVPELRVLLDSMGHV